MRGREVKWEGGRQEKSKGVTEGCRKGKREGRRKKGKKRDRRMQGGI